MMKQLACMLLVVALAAPAAAHHGLTGITGVDATRTVTIRGTVASMEWQNPHVSVAVDVRAADGRMDRWIVAASPLNAMVRKGLQRDWLKVGDTLGVTGYTASGSRVMNATEFTLPDGRSFKTGNENWKPVSVR